MEELSMILLSLKIASGALVYFLACHRPYGTRVCMYASSRTIFQEIQKYLMMPQILRKNPGHYVTVPTMHTYACKDKYGVIKVGGIADWLTAFMQQQQSLGAVG
eukprot:scaffold4248_cov107-Skeletonema_marinoi.AAC.5